MTDAELQSLVAGNYLALADLADDLPAAAWDTPSLCEGWRVREVVAHLTMPARYDEDAFMAELRESGFDFTALSNRIAGRDAQLPTEQLVRDLRDDVLHRWMPPGGGARGALSHVVIHGLDITVPLGRRTVSDDASIAVVLEGLAEGGGHSNFGVDITGRSLRASDIEWSFGSGVPLVGSATDLLLHLCGRTLPAGRLEGETST